MAYYSLLLKKKKKSRQAFEADRTPVLEEQKECLTNVARMRSL